MKSADSNSFYVCFFVSPTTPHSSCKARPMKFMPTALLPSLPPPLPPPPTFRCCQLWINPLAPQSWSSAPPQLPPSFLEPPLTPNLYLFKTLVKVFSSPTTSASYSHQRPSRTVTIRNCSLKSPIPPFPHCPHLSTFQFSMRYLLDVSQLLTPKWQKQRYYSVL